MFTCIADGYILDSDNIAGNGCLSNDFLFRNISLHFCAMNI